MGLAGRIKCFQDVITGRMGSHKTGVKQEKVMIRFKVLENHRVEYRGWEVDGGSKGGSGKQDEK